MSHVASKREIIIVPDEDALAETAAQRLVARLAANRGRPAICLTGGSTPQRLYQLLATSQWRSQIAWERVHWFMTDNRFVPAEDPLSNMGMARAAFLDALAPRENVHAISAIGTPEEAAEHYEQELRIFHSSSRGGQSPLFDLVLMGVGPDGHTASLFPGFPELAEQRKWVVGVPRANVTPFVPRVSLTLPCLASTREMLFLASGSQKKDILTEVFNSDDLPASQAASAGGETIWLIDKAAAPHGISNAG